MTRMRVGIGAALAPTGGPVRYAQHLVPALARQPNGAEYVVFTNRPAVFAGAGVRVVNVPLPSPVLEPLWDHVLVPLAARRWKLDLYHGVKGALPLPLGCRQVVTIHDLAVYARPRSFAWPQHLHMRPHLRLAAARACRIIADSEHARADIMRRFRLSPERVVTVPLGVRPALFSPHPAPDEENIVRRLQLPPRYFVYAGTVQPRKNLDLTITAFTALRVASEWSFLVAGRVRPYYRPQWLHRAPAGVRYLGVVADEELAVIYRRATALVSPSSYEGFGLSLLEAMASGCPVIAAAATAVPEVVGDAGLLLATVSCDGLRAAMRRLIDDAQLHHELKRRGTRRAREFTWEATARRTQAVYAEVAGGGGD